jgi:hypothetical protein
MSFRSSARRSVSCPRGGHRPAIPVAAEIGIDDGEGDLEVVPLGSQLH